MKKSELKNMIKECVREVIFEDGVLSGVVTEVVRGLGGTNLVVESRTSTNPVKTTPPDAARRAVLDSIGRDHAKSSSALEEKLARTRANFPNPALFEGTVPIPTDDQLSDNDPGININNIPGMGKWAAIASTQK
jgi:hypothetical protein